MPFANEFSSPLSACDLSPSRVCEELLHSRANAGVLQTLLASGPAGLSCGQSCALQGTEQRLWVRPLDANSTCSQLRRPDSSPDFASCSLRVKSHPPPLENPRVTGKNCFQLWEQEGGWCGAPPGGGDQNQMHRSDRHTAAH